MFGDGEILVETAFRTFLVRVDRFRQTLLTDAQREDALRLAFELRFGLECGYPELEVAAQRLAHALLGSGPLRLRRRDATPERRRYFQSLREFLEDQLQAGRLVVLQEPAIANVPEQELTVRLPRPNAQPPAQLVPRREARLETLFEVRFVDEIGQGIRGLDVEIQAGDRVAQVTTNAAGVALLDGTTAGSGTVSVLDLDALDKILTPRWARARIGRLPTGPNTTRQQFSGEELSPTDIKGGVPNTIVITPVLGALFAELWDRNGRVLLAQRDYAISGPSSFEGRTDDAGRLRHEAVPNGEYTLTLSLTSFKGDPDEVTDSLQSPLVVLDAGEGSPQTRLIGAMPRSVVAQLHMFFNTNKTFLLPTALPEVRKLRELYAENAPCELLVVGHADTRGPTAYNDKLSLERAETTISYLKDDVDGWLKFYGPDVESQKRWGKVEDHLMVISMPDFVSKGPAEDAIKWYQRTRGLSVDGVAGHGTRSALIAEYMSLDGASLADAHGEIVATAHGCGENFPLDDSGEQLDAAPADDKRDPIDRRVELFFFDPEFGISPPPPGQNSGPGSSEYPLWRARVAEVVELRAGDPDAPRVTFVEMADAHFRTNSAAVLPEGENPDSSGTHRALSAVGVIATALRFNEEHPGRTTLVAGHTDTTADLPFNQKLSEERAKVALALLLGGNSSRETFKTVCDGRHTVADIKQILSWVAQAFAPLVFDCDPGAIDENAATLALPVSAFQRDFNTNSQAVGSSATLKVDGSVGPLTWGAFFDCFELALQQELGETAASLATLRGKLTFTDPNHPFLGFSEYFPIEELGVDNFRSQTNRRVEILFFEPGEEPDVQHAADDPETSDLYLPGFFERDPVEPMISAKPWVATWKGPFALMQGGAFASLAAPELPAGVPFEVEVTQVGFGPIATLSVASGTNSVQGIVPDWYAPDSVQFAGSLNAAQPFPVATFTFVATGGGRRIENLTPLPYADRLFVQLVLTQAGGPPIANTNYLLCSPWGSRAGRTDAQGRLDETNLPPGGASVILNGQTLADFQLINVSWDSNG